MIRNWDSNPSDLVKGECFVGRAANYALRIVLFVDAKPLKVYHKHRVKKVFNFSAHHPTGAFIRQFPFQFLPL